MESVCTFTVGLRIWMYSFDEAIKFAATFRDDAKLFIEAFRHFTIVLEVTIFENRRQLNNLSTRLNVTVQPMFVSLNLQQQLKRYEFKPLLSINNVLSMNLNVTCVMQGMWDIRVVTCKSAYKGILESHNRLTNIITFNTIMKCLNASLNNLTSSRNVDANFIASSKKYYSFACVKQHWTCKRISSAPRCLFRLFIVIYAYLVPFLICICYLTNSW